MLWYVAAVVVILDQLTKYWAVKVLAPGRTIVIFENFLQLTYATNRGGAAGLLQSQPQLLTVLSILALGVILWWALTVPREERVARFGFGMILGGAVGNLLDRLFRGGFFFNTYVVDFIDAHWYNQEHLHWPTFNLADTAICTGIAVVLIGSLFGPRKAAAPQPPAVATDGSRPEPPSKTPD
ncbi:MAG: signal peptidase II [Candidatus Sumerlaeia bacterium]|nr:signal peptidase II [Candidatus Sumerlaeia bacterium]